MTTISAVKSCDLCRNKGICKYADIMQQVIKDYKVFAEESFAKLPDELKGCRPFIYHEPTCKFFSESVSPVFRGCNCP